MYNVLMIEVSTPTKLSSLKVEINSNIKDSSQLPCIHHGTNNECFQRKLTKEIIGRSLEIIFLP